MAGRGRKKEKKHYLNLKFGRLEYMEGDRLMMAKLKNHTQ